MDFKLTKIRFEMKKRRAASFSPELNQGKVIGLKLWPHLADCVRVYKNYIFVSF
jgi:hypothetical protein